MAAWTSRTQGPRGPGLGRGRAEIAAGQLDVRITDAGKPTILTADGRWEPFRPTTNAAQGWTIIERERIPVVWNGGPSEGLLGAMRAYLARQR